MHGLTPTQARAPGAVLHSQPQLRFHLRVEGSKEAFVLVGFRTRVPLIYEGPNQSIEQFEQNLDKAATHRLLAISNVDPAGALSVTGNISEHRTEGSELDYWHAVATSQPAPEGFDRLDVPAGLWVVFETQGTSPKVLQYL